MISSIASIYDIRKSDFDFESDIDNHSAVGRKRINEEQMPARFPAGTLARIDAVLWSGEKRADLIRIGVERELKRRERAQVREGQLNRTSAEGRRNG